MGDLKLETAVPILRTNKAIITTARYTLMEEVYPMTVENLSKKAHELYKRAEKQGFFGIDGWGLYEPSYKRDKKEVINTLKEYIEEIDREKIKNVMETALNKWSNVNDDIPIFYIS